MNSIFKFFLASHVVFGLLGIVALYAVWIRLLKTNVSSKSLRKMSLWGTIFLILSWGAGGYYYLYYYGQKVKAVILSGKYAWAHSIFTESKEHVFLFLPFLAITLTVVLFSAGDGLDMNVRLKKELKFLSGILVILGILITLSGAAISGGVR